MAVHDLHFRSQFAPLAPPDVPAAAPAAGWAGQMGAEVEHALASALERVAVLSATGRIDRPGLRALRDEIEHARRLGRMGQQLQRLAEGRLRTSPEPLDLQALMREALLQRAPEIERRGLDVRQTLQPAVVVTDPALGAGLLQALLDWAFQHACAQVELAIDRKLWPEHARVVCGFAYVPADEVTSGPLPLAGPVLDTLAWQLLEQTARTLGLPVRREDRAGHARVLIEFPNTVTPVLQGMPQLAPDAGTALLAGAPVLVVSARREVRNQVRDALRPHGVLLDLVTSVDEAREFCRCIAPAVLVHEVALGGENLERLRRELKADAARTGFVQITEGEVALELHQAGPLQTVSVGRAALATQLPQALAWVLSRRKPS